MNEIYRHDLINPETVVYGVIGDPIGHSLSPHIHNAALRRAGINAVYVPFRVPAEDLNQFLDDCRELGVQRSERHHSAQGSGDPEAHKIDPEVKGIGAANTVVFGTGDSFPATIPTTARRSTRWSAPCSRRYDRGNLKGKTVLVLGAGGAARADRLRPAGVVRPRSIISSRTARRAQQLAEQMQCKWVDWNNRYGVTPDMIVNCTPVGMHPNVDETPYDRLHLRPYTVVFDTVYNPESTLFIKEARMQGCLVVTGVEMFIRQASLQFKLFTGKDAPGN